jgi:hypothetical protein
VLLGLLCAAALLLAAGCGTSPAESETPPPPAESETPEPTPHEHSWADGVCRSCGAVCAHEWADGVCTICGKVCTHEWADGACAVCGMPCAHQWKSGVCTVCGLACAHEWADGVCTICGLRCLHSWADGVCTVCGAVCEHEWYRGACRRCAMPCAHEWRDDGFCAICGLPCSHDWQDGVCTICGLRCRHEHHDPETCLCTACGLPVEHRYVNGRCIFCGEEPAYVMDRLDYPKEVLQGTEDRGTLESFLYDRRTGEIRTGTRREDKFDFGFVIYTPYGYDPERQYNVVLLMPGVNQDCHTWLEKNIAFDATYHHFKGRDLLDGMIACGYCEPTIFVSVEYFQNGAPDRIARDLEQDLRTIILPYVVGHYGTYSSLDEKGAVTPEREHFAFVAVSFGSIVAWDLMTYCSDLFSYWGCYAGCFADRETIAARIDATAAAGYPENFVYTGVGLQEEGWNTLRKYSDEMIAECSSLEYGKNIVFHEINHSIHWYSCWFIHLHNSMQIFFKTVYEPG